MKKLLTILSLSLVLFTQGCALTSALMPKRVEFFQDKVQKVPFPSRYEQELQRESADRAKKKAAETVLAATDEGCSTNVLAPAKETAVLTDSLSTSLGPPAKIPSSDVTSPALAEKLTKEVAKLNAKIDTVRQENNKDAGKKIEGTGAISIPYFLYAGGIALLLFIGWHLAHTALTLAAAANPGAAVGVAGMNVASTVLSKGFQQLVTGGNEFKDWVEKEVTDPTLKQKIVDAFTALHKQSQDSDVKVLVDKVNGK